MRLVVSTLFVVGFSFGSVHADRKVDWSQYLEQPGDRVPKKSTPVVASGSAKKSTAPRAAAAKQQRPAKAVAKRKQGRRR